MSSNVSFSFSDLPSCLEEWTSDDVQRFLMELKLGETVLPLCRNVDGPRLKDFHEMCMINRESMYQSLKHELHCQHKTLLPVSDYLTFIHEIRRFLPVKNTNSSSSSLLHSNHASCYIL